MIYNYGTIEADTGPTSERIHQAVAATPSTNQAILFVNETDARVIGDLNLAGGNDTVELLPGSIITGNLNGGGGTDTLVLNSDISRPGQLDGQLNNFEILTKTGIGEWEITGALSNTGGSLAVDVNQGTLTLTGNNPTFRGSMTVDAAGTLQIGNGGTTGSLNNDITDNGAVVFNRSDSLTFANVISGTGMVAQSGTGTTILIGANTYSGGTTINSGTLAAGADSALGNAAGGLTFNGGTFRFNQSFNLAGTRSIVIEAPGGTIDTQGFTSTITQGITGAGALTKAGSGSLVLTGDSSYGGGTVISAGTLQLGNGGTGGAITGDVADNGALVFDRADTYTFDGTISGSGAVGQAGAGTTVLTADSSYAGGTTISAGTLQLGNGGTTGSIIGDIVDDGVLAFDRSDEMTIPGVISGSGAVAQIGSGTTILTADDTYTGGTSISAGTLQLGNGGTTGSIVGDVADNGMLAFDRSDTLVFPGVVSGSGALAQIGSGTTVLTANNTYAGGTSISAGTLAVGDAGHAGASLSGGGPIVISGQGTLAGYGSVTGTVVNGGTIAVANALPLFASGPVGTFTVNGNLQNAGLLNLASHGAPGNVLAVTGGYSAIGSNSVLVLGTVFNAGGPLSNQFTDRLLVTGDPVGSTTVRIVNAGGAGAITSFTGVPTATDGISIIQIAGASSPTAFVLPGGYVDGGTPFQYRLNAYGPGSPNGPAAAAQSLVGNAGNQWDFRLQNAFVTPGGPVPPEPEPGAPGEPSPSFPPLPPDARPAVAPQVPAYISTPRALFQTGFLDLDSLHRRLGEIRDDQIQGRDQPTESFVRVYGSVSNYTTDRRFQAFGYNFSLDYGAVQFGANRKVIDDADGTLRVGLAGTLGQAWMQPSAVDGSSKSTFDTESIAGLVTWQDRSGWYVDGIVMGGLFDGRTTTPGRGDTTGMNGTSVALSVEVGKPFPLPWWELSVEPQVQMVWQHLDFARRSDVDGISIDMGSPNQGVARLGARLTRPFVTEDGMRFTPYLKANLLQGIGGGSSVKLDGIGFGTGEMGTALQVGGGLTGTLTRDLSFYGDVAWQDHVADDGGFRGWVFSTGLRFIF